MSYLFHIDSRSKTVLRPECVKLCPELAALDEQEVLFIILAFDHFSPLRRYPEQDRVRRSMLQVWMDNKPKLLAAIEGGDHHHRINVAIRAYKSLQYDPKVELIDKYQETVDTIRTEITSELSDKDLKSKLENIKQLREHIRALDVEITEAIIEEGQIKGDQELSYLEKIQKNKQLYEYVTKKKKNA
jgi:hypothetical protein